MNPRRHCSRTIHTARVHVRCSGSLHEIRLKRNGALVFRDHDYAELRAETALRLAANLPPAHRCEVILRRWRDKWVSGKLELEAMQAGISCSIPTELERAYNSIRWRNDPKPRPSIALPSYGVPWRERLAKRVEAIAEEYIYRADYRRSASTWAGGEHEILVIVDKTETVDIEGESRRARSDNNKWSGSFSTITAWLRYDWLSTVARRGLALVPDKHDFHHFVLMVCPWLDAFSLKTKRSVLRPNEVVAIVGKQGRGFSVKPCRAVINTESARLIRWIGNGTRFGVKRKPGYDLTEA